MSLGSPKGSSALNKLIFKIKKKKVKTFFKRKTRQGRSERNTEGSIGAEKSSINGVIVGKDVGAVDAARLNGMVGLCVEHGVYVVTSTTAAHRLCRPMK